MLSLQGVFGQLFDPDQFDFALISNQPTDFLSQDAEIPKPCTNVLKAV